MHLHIYLLLLVYRASVRRSLECFDTKTKRIQSSCHRLAHFDHMQTPMISEGIPEIVASKSRMTPKQMFNFEKLLATSDAVASSVFEHRRIERKRKRECKFGKSEQEHVYLKLQMNNETDRKDTHDDDDDDSTRCEDYKEIAIALVKSISCMTGCSEPGRLENASDAMKWVRDSILQSKHKTVDDVRREQQLYVFDADQTLAAMKLIQQLSELLSNTRTRHSITH